MDIYGYPSYQYNQSDELAKQMFAQQALASSAQFPQPEPVPHPMQMPTSSSWNSQGLPWGMPSPPPVVQFTASPFRDGKFNSIQHCKRKSLDFDPPIPAKQLITEEKMAAHLNGLHISSQYTPHYLASEDTDVWMEMANNAFDAQKLKGHTIVLSEEIKKIQEEPLLPAVLIERFEKPTMSLVVWKPRENILENIKEQDEKPKQEKEEDSPKKRNGVLVSDDVCVNDDAGINDVEM